MKTVLILSLFLCFWSQAQDILLPESTTGQVIHHSYYSLSYSEDHEQAEWVAYRLNPEMVLGTQSRTNDFREDPYVDTGSAGPQDYRSSGYDRG
ncbi:MAG: DNA/RNA non-specific endonuclease, partial [Halobacteriovoraceae bacterium]|nr:DNA/RNA non-specific endonuclease [Halobacteriovoraceae bacterium]